MINSNTYKMKKKERVKPTNTGLLITYKENGNINTCVSPYDNAVTNKPLP